MPRAALLLCALLLVSTPCRARAGESETDFLPGNESWNGLSAVAAMASAMGQRLQLTHKLDWATLPPGSALMIIHPRVEVPPAQLAAVLSRGGKVLLADDFGRGGAALSQFNISLVASPPGARRLHRGNPNLPLARPGSAPNPLTRGVGNVVTNHPAYLRSRLPALVHFGEADQQLLVAARVGKGELLALSDPSVLINTMMQFRGNRALARNLLQRLATRGSTGAITVLSGAFSLSGTLPPPAKADGADGTAASFLREFNVFLGDLNSFSLVDAGLRAVAVVFCLIGLLGLFMILPLPRRDMDGHWSRAAGSDPAGLEEDVVRFGQRWRGGGAAYPAALLREEVEEHLGALLDAPSPLSTVHPHWIIGKVQQHSGPEAARLCRKLLAALRGVPGLGLEAERPRLSGVSPRELRELYKLSEQLFAAMGSGPLFPAPSGGTQGKHVHEH